MDGGYGLDGDSGFWRVFRVCVVVWNYSRLVVVWFEWWLEGWCACFCLKSKDRTVPCVFGCGVKRRDPPGQSLPRGMDAKNRNMKNGGALGFRFYTTHKAMKEKGFGPLCVKGMKNISHLVKKVWDCGVSLCSVEVLYLDLDVFASFLDEDFLDVCLVDEFVVESVFSL